MRIINLLAFGFLLPTTLAALQYKGSDWSSLLIEERGGKTYKSSTGETLPLETILKNSGHNTVRSRIWVNPANGDYNLDYNLKLAARAQAAGLLNYLDFHYSDTWADPGHNKAPAAWASLGVDAMAATVKNYTKNTLDAFAARNLSLALVSIGNEIRAGFLWPVGQQSGSSGGFANIAKLLSAAAQGVKESNLSPKPKIMVHIDNGWDWETQKWWYDNVLAAGSFKKEDFDVQGVSYYPFYNPKATLASLQTSLSNMKKTYGKEVMVVETDWPISCPSPKYAFPSDAKSIPFTAEGQSQWIQEVAKRVEAAGGNGLFYWEPAWIDNANLGSSCASNLMVDTLGKALSSLDVFKAL